MIKELETGAVDPRSCHKLIITGLQTFDMFTGITACQPAITSSNFRSNTLLIARS